MVLDLLKMLLLALVAACAVLFWLQNASLLAQPLPAVLRLPLIEVRPFPPDGPRIDVLLVLAFAAGYALAYGLGIVRRIRAALEIRRLRRQVAGAAELIGDKEMGAS
jgi:hypothetical protein